MRIQWIAKPLGLSLYDYRTESNMIFTFSTMVPLVSGHPVSNQGMKSIALADTCHLPQVRHTHEGFSRRFRNSGARMAQ